MQRYHLLIAVHLSLVFVSAVRGQEKMVRELEALQVQFQTRVKTDAEEPFQKGLADLNGQYARALDLALEEAQKFGKLDEAVKIKTEQLRVTSGQPMPMADEGDLSDSLKCLRQTYRKSLSLLVNRRDTPIFVLQKAYAKQLNELIAALTKQGRLEDALAVRERLIALPPSGAVLTPPIAEQPQPLVPGNPPTPMKPFGPLPKDGFTNSLGMKFVAVPDTNVLMCIHETRRQD